jgi:hypothetical protein
MLQLGRNFLKHVSRHSSAQKQRPAFGVTDAADLLAGRYDLANSAAAGVTMSRGKPVQAGVRARLPAGATWE